MKVLDDNTKDIDINAYFISSKLINKMKKLQDNQRMFQILIAKSVKWDF